jgi:hypothetical protein
LIVGWFIFLEWPNCGFAGHFPYQLVGLRSRNLASREQDLVLPQVAPYLADTPQCHELGKHQLDDMAYLIVGILDHRPIWQTQVACGQLLPVRAPLDLRHPP